MHVISIVGARCSFDTMVQWMNVRITAEMRPCKLAVPGTLRRTIMPLKFASTSALLVLAVLETFGASARASDNQSSLDAPYSNMPSIAPIGVRIGHYQKVPEDAKGPPVDPAKGYRLQELGKGLYMITDNAIQSMFMVYETGVVVMDAPQAYAAHIVAGISEVSDKPITHLIYSHSHADHIGGATSLGNVLLSLRRRKPSDSCCGMTMPIDRCRP